MSTKKLSITTYDYNELNQDFIEFIKSVNTEFSDIDYEGSNIKLINSILSRNTQLTGYAANMLASESLWATTNLRKNLVAQASQLSYVPRSKTASQSTVKITVIPVEPQTQTNILAEAGLNFVSSVNSETAYFVNTNPFTLSLVNGNYVSDEITIYEGSFNSITKTHTQNQPIIIEDTNIDTSTLKVFIDNSDSDLSNTEYTLATTVKELTENSLVYFITQNQDSQYEIRFGQNTFGTEPPEGAVIRYEYVSVDAINSNATAYTLNDSIDGYTNTSIETIIPSYGGAEEESIESIRFIAPLAYKAQERVVNSYDAIPLLKKKYGFIKSGIAWGGEKNIPPKFGNIIISLLTTDGSSLSPYIKDEMIEYLDPFCVGSVTPIIMDGKYVNINPSVFVKYDRGISSKSFTAAKAEITALVEEYGEEIRDYNKFFNTSEIISRIKDIEEITSVYILADMYITGTKNTSQNYTYSFNFANPITNVLIENIMVDISADSQRVYDQSGKLFYEKTVDGVVSSREIGVVDYTKGIVSFELNNIAADFKVMAKAVEKNIYAINEIVLNIDTISVNEVTK